MASVSRATSVSKRTNASKRSSVSREANASRRPTISQGKPASPTPGWAVFLWLGVFLPFFAGSALGEDIRGSMPFIRSQAMGGSYIALADESSALFHNPAALPWLKTWNVELLTLQMTANELTKDLFFNPQKVASQFQQITAANISSLVNQTVFADVQLVVPMLVFPKQGVFSLLGAEFLSNLEILDTKPLPSLRVEVFADKMFIAGGGGKLGDHFSYGYDLRTINRTGVDKTYSFLELFVAGVTIDPTLLPEVNQAFNQGISYTNAGWDLGAMVSYPELPGSPRAAITSQNITLNSQGHLHGIEFGPRATADTPPRAGELPQLNTLGLAFTSRYDVYRLTLGVDYVDFTNTVLPHKEWIPRTRVGVEAAIWEHTDGTPLMSVMGGFNGYYTSWGVMTRVWFFEMGYSQYTVEVGSHKGDWPDQRRSVIIGFRF
ncbi:MAG: hypothetical protein OEW12_09670 [Deltaproteobacteria bacterium]|nr:hypothetical protein [Deltaproteobacteria bacterium]